MNSDKLANYAPSNFSFSPCDRHLTYLHAESHQMERQLWAADLETLETKEVASPPSDGGDTEENLSLDEKLRRERRRAYSLGITAYTWAPTLPLRLLIPLQGSLYIQEGAGGGPLRCIYDAQAHGGAGAIDPQFSPDSRWVAFVRDGDVHVVSVDADRSAPPIRVTYGAGPGITNGLAEFIAQEEMDRYSGFWWSPDSRSIAYAEVDERHIPVYTITHQGKEDLSEPSQEEHRYPFAGKGNARVRLAVTSLALPLDGNSIPSGSTMGAPLPPPPPSNGASSAPVFVDMAGLGDDFYLARVHWLPDGFLGVQVQSRDQKVLRLLRADPRTGATTTLLEETSKLWVNLNDLFWVLKRPLPPLDASGDSGNGRQLYPDGLPPGSFSFLWGSERTDFMHLYLYTYVPGPDSPGAVLCGVVTSGDWLVESIAAVDEARNLVYVTGTFDSPLERHLYAVPLAPLSPRTFSSGVSGYPLNPPVRLTWDQGMHSVTFDRGARRFVTVFSSLESPSKTRLYALPDAVTLVGQQPGGVGGTLLRPALLRELHDACDSRLSSVREKLVVPEIFSFHPRDDPSTELFGAIYRPNAAIYGPGPYPTVVSVYGGPHVQKVNRSWGMTVDMMAQRLRDLGLVVVKCDNRGSSRRGLRFEAPVHLRFGDVEVRDQEDAVKYLASQGLVHLGHVGVYGWSYGGYMSCMCLAKASYTFRAAVAGAPVTSWDGYDTHYTERYMGTPADNPEGYRQSSVLAHADRINGKLLLVHGQVDENVHFRHTARLINALVSARKSYELVLFPDGRHSLRKAEDRVYLEQRLTEFLVQHLLRDSTPAVSAHL